MAKVIHVVLFRWNEDARQEQIDAAFGALRQLPDLIPGIVELTCGPNFTDRSQGYQAGVVVRFINRAALEAYLPHPDHVAAVRDYINPIRAASLALDYEVP